MSSVYKKPNPNPPDEKNLSKLMEAEIVFGTRKSFLVDRVPDRHLGYCYQCKYAGHTVKHCPLSYCTSCNSYGHVYRVCPERQRQEIITMYGCDAVKKPRVSEQLSDLPPLPSFVQHGVSLPPSLGRSDDD